MTDFSLAISNHADLLGGGEHSFIELLSPLFPPWKPVAVVPEQGDVAVQTEQKQNTYRSGDIFVMPSREISKAGEVERLGLV